MENKDLTGMWRGTIVYGNEYRSHKGRELYFEAEIIQQGNEITGMARDTGGTGMSPDPAYISGSYQHPEINFIKQYSSFHYYSAKDGATKTDASQKGPQIKYTGIYNEQSNSFSGSWIIKAVVRFLWLFPVTLKTTGTWTMQRQ